jgi:hypothetical protein
MADTLKSQYGPEVAERIAAMIGRVHPTFATRAFVAQALEGYEALELLPRARHIARAMAAHLPAKLVASLHQSVFEKPLKIKTSKPLCLE